jgi:hypothetical protein
MEIKFNNLAELQIVLESGKIKSPKFISINNYENENGEVSNYIINLGVDFMKKKKEDAIILSMMNVTSFDFPVELQPIAQQAYDKVLLSLRQNSSDNAANRTTASVAQTELYRHLCANIKQHNVSGDIYLTGFRVRKITLVEGTYKADTRGDMKKATDIITNVLSTSAYRIFKINKILNAKINGIIIEQE